MVYLHGFTTVCKGFACTLQCQKPATLYCNLLKYLLSIQIYSIVTSAGAFLVLHAILHAILHNILV